MSTGKEGARPRKRLASVYDRLGQRLGRDLFEEVQRAGSRRPGFSFSRAVAGVMALLIHGLRVGLFVGGLALLVAGWPNLVFVILGLLALAISVVFRPRWPDVPGTAVSPEQAPRLHALASHVAEAAGTKPANAIRVGSRFNAAVLSRRWGRRRHLYIGLPLFAILEPQERVAVLGHEFAHYVNGDPRRSAFAGSAINTLRSWHDLLRPSRIVPGRRRGGLIDKLSHAIGQALTLALAAGLRGIHAVMVHLTYRDSQRAEYLADAVARRIAGTDAAASALRKLSLRDLVAGVVQRATVRQHETGTLIPKIRDAALERSHAEIERIEEQELARGFRLDATHPPTAYRIRFVERERVPAAMTLSNGELEAVDRELQPFEARIERELIDNYRATLYR